MGRAIEREVWHGSEVSGRGDENDEDSAGDICDDSGHADNRGGGFLLSDTQPCGGQLRVRPGDRTVEFRPAVGIGHHHGLKCGPADSRIPAVRA